MSDNLMISESLIGKIDTSQFFDSKVEKDHTFFLVSHV